MTAVPLPPEVLFQNDDLVIVNKPAGLPSHAGPRGGRSAEDWFPLLSRRRRGPWLAHRLDMDTAGCLVIALKKSALIELQAAFASGRIRKTYWAVCAQGAESLSAGRCGTISLPLSRRSSKAGWSMTGDPDGRSAVTEWRVLGATDAAAWLELAPRTGRTHQIRVHCAALGHPILGDSVYGEAGGALQLLARAISLPLAAPISACAPVPPHMRLALAANGWHDRVSRAGTTS